MSNLRQLLAAYFHQDWFLEYDGSWEAGVDDFARREPDRVAGAIAEIDSLLEATNSDEELVRAMDALGNCRSAGDAPHAYRAWLVGIRDRLTARH